MAIDNEEEFEKLCGKCKSKADTPRCGGCGSENMDSAYEVNPNFDDSIFDKYKSVRE